MFGREELSADRRLLGLARGDVVMVHASVRAVGEVAGGPDEIHLAIKDVLESEGALMMYASVPRYVDEVGRGNLTRREEEEVVEKLPPFDPLTARSARDNGALVEMLRTYPGSRVNHHPARFVVWGKQTDYLLSQQPWDYALGRDSARERVVELDGKILRLGSDHDAVTFLHYAEHIADIPDKRVARFKVPVLEQGGRCAPRRLRQSWRKRGECTVLSTARSRPPRRRAAGDARDRTWRNVTGNVTRFERTLIVRQRPLICTFRLAYHEPASLR